MLMDNDLDELLNNDAETPAAHSHKRKSLGRGLGALLGSDELDEVPGSSEKTKPSDKVNINSIIPGKFQPRTEFDAEALQALAESIREKGVLQPLLVREMDGRYELIAGERRWRASKLAGLTDVPVIIKKLSDQEVLEVALVENLLRENLSAIEEAEAFQRLINEFSHTQEALAKIVGKSRSHVANTLRLLTLPSDIKEMVKDGRLSAGHARALVGIENAESLAAKIISKDLNVRQVEELVSRSKEPKETKKRKSSDGDLAQIEQDLIKTLGLRIKISPSKQGGGKVVLQYASVAELDMIVETLQQKRRMGSPQGTNTVFKTEAPASSEKFSIKIVD